MAATCASISSRSTSPSRMPCENAYPALVVASASNPSVASSRAVPGSHGLGMMNARSRACSARNACPFSACDTPERAIDHLHERPLFPEDQTSRFGHREVLAPVRVRAQLHAIRLVRREALERNQAPGHVVRAFVRQEVADEPAAAPRDDAAPILSVSPEDVLLKRVDLVANHAGDGHAFSLRLARQPRFV